MFRFIKKQSRPSYYLTLALFLGVIGGLVLLFVKLLDYLPD
jgi:uncharacterized membrane protein YagU involved in acid resistance